MKRLTTHGDVFIWLTGAFLGLSIIMIVGMLVLIASNGIGYFNPRAIEQITAVTTEGDTLNVLGQVYATEDIPREVIMTKGFDASKEHLRYLLRIGNREVFGQDFQWVNGPEIMSRKEPADAVGIERREYGHAYGFIESLQQGPQRLIDNSVDAWDAFRTAHAYVTGLSGRIYDIEKSEIGGLNYRLQELRKRLRTLEYQVGQGGIDKDEYDREVGEIQNEIDGLELSFTNQQVQVDSLKALLEGYILRLRLFGSPSDETIEIPVASIVRAYKPNLMTTVERVAFYGSKIWEFLSADPREANAEGGVFPAIFGTVLMVLIMTVVAVPFGVLAALYLREYAVDGPMVRIVRIAVNNLAGVPSIVFGMFGLGFFVYFVGGSIDALFYPEHLPSPTYGTGGILWASLTLALLTVPVVIVATEEALAAIPRGMREGSLALGATKWETVRRVVLPSATPGIMTGAILAMARGAGEVAPLMITGVVKLATELPFDSHFPFFHLDRKFMHLGFHIYDVGFQTSNVEANIGMVYTTTLLLLLIVLALNLGAIILRARLRTKYRLAGF
ncbi:MAG: phosphate ABC transporter permease PstA [Bacteroidota bacterium]